MEVNMLDVKLKDVKLKNNLIEKIVREEIKLQYEKEEIKILGELVKHQQNNWNELKECVIDLFNRSQDTTYLDVLEKMQELENKQCHTTSE